MTTEPCHNPRLCSPSVLTPVAGWFCLQPQLLLQALKLRITLWRLASDPLSLSLSCFLSLIGAGACLGLVRLPLPPSSSAWLKSLALLAFWAHSPFGVLCLGLCLPLIYMLWCLGVDWFLAHSHAYMSWDFLFHYQTRFLPKSTSL